MYLNKSLNTHRRITVDHPYQQVNEFLRIPLNINLNKTLILKVYYNENHANFAQRTATHSLYCYINSIGFTFHFDHSIEYFSIKIERANKTWYTTNISNRVKNKRYHSCIYHVNNVFNFGGEHLEKLSLEEGH